MHTSACSFSLLTAEFKCRSTGRATCGMHFNFSARRQILSCQWSFKETQRWRERQTLADQWIDISPSSLDIKRLLDLKADYSVIKMTIFLLRRKQRCNFLLKQRNRVYEEEDLWRRNGIIAFLLGSVFFKKHPFWLAETPYQHTSSLCVPPVKCQRCVWCVSVSGSAYSPYRQ